MRSGSVENTYEGGHGGGVGGPVVADVGEEDSVLGAGEAVAITASSAVCCGGGGSGEEDSVLGAGEAVAITASSAVCGGEGGSGEVDGEEMGLGAGGGEEGSGVQGGVDGDSCGELSKEHVHAGVVADAGVGLGGDHVGGGGECGGGER
jgi:hypothetical protein